VFEHRSGRVSLRELMADRTGAERWWAGARPANPVGIALSASLVTPLLFGGPMPMGPAAIRPGPRFWTWVYRDPEWTDCRQTLWEHDSRKCRHFVERARRVRDPPRSCPRTWCRRRSRARLSHGSVDDS